MKESRTENRGTPEVGCPGSHKLQLLFLPHHQGNPATLSVAYSATRRISANRMRVIFTLRFFDAKVVAPQNDDLFRRAWLSKKRSSVRNAG